MDAEGTFATCVTWCVLLALLCTQGAAGTSLHRATFCQLYGLGGTADVQESDTLEQCTTKCTMQTNMPCQKALFYGGLGCCVYYATEAVYDMACDTLFTNGYKALHVSGCKAREKPTLLMLQKVTPPSPKTTPRVTTTTTQPNLEGPAETTMSMTTAEAADDEMPETEDLEGCDEVIVTPVQPAWLNLQTKLRNESAHYFCHKLCRGPLPAKYPWLKPPKSDEDCKSLKDYDSTLCASFLENIMRRWNGFKDGQLTLTLCTHELDDVTTEGSVTDSTVTGVTGVTGDDVTGVTGGDGADVTTVAT